MYSRESLGWLLKHSDDRAVPLKYFFFQQRCSDSSLRYPQRHFDVRPLLLPLSSPTDPSYIAIGWQCVYVCVFDSKGCTTFSVFVLVKDTLGEPAWPSYQVESAFFMVISLTVCRTLGHIAPTVYCMSQYRSPIYTRPTVHYVLFFEVLSVTHSASVIKPLKSFIFWNKRVQQTEQKR